MSTMFEPTALFPQLVAAGYWTSIVGKVHNDQAQWLCSPGKNRTDAFTHVGTLCNPCGNYWGDEYVVKDVGDATGKPPVHRPNLVYILNDDTDVLLGSADTLMQTRALLGDAGAEFTQFRTLSPKCTPSRTGQLVGRHYHNVRPRQEPGTPSVEAPDDGTPRGGGLDMSTMFEPTALFP